MTRSFFKYTTPFSLFYKISTRVYLCVFRLQLPLFFRPVDDLRPEQPLLQEVSGQQQRPRRHRVGLRRAGRPRQTRCHRSQRKRTGMGALGFKIWGIGVQLLDERGRCGRVGSVIPPTIPHTTIELVS